MVLENDVMFISDQLTFGPSSSRPDRAPNYYSPAECGIYPPTIKFKYDRDVLDCEWRIEKDLDWSCSSLDKVQNEVGHCRASNVLVNGSRILSAAPYDST